MNSYLNVMEQALQETAVQARQLSPDAEYYWRCHAPRYRYIGALLQQIMPVHEISRALDVGMGFEVGVLARILGHARLDCLGTYEDDRFRPPRDYRFYQTDLNDVANASRPDHVEPYDLLVCMEVIEHLYAPPERVLQALASWVKDTGMIVLTTPNAAWLKNRVKMVCGKNPFELLRPDTRNMGHIREYTRSELLRAIGMAGLRCIHCDVRGLYRFNNAKDNFYSAVADLTLPTLRRTLVAVCEKQRSAVNHRPALAGDGQSASSAAPGGASQPTALNHAIPLRPHAVRIAALGRVGTRPPPPSTAQDTRTSASRR